jgi:Collagen triple helix repeat (20 copies)
MTHLLSYGISIVSQRRDRRGAKQPMRSVQCALCRRLVTRITPLAGAISLLVFFSFAEAAAAAQLVSVSPTSGCPATEVTFTGTGFTGATTRVAWADPTAQSGSPTSVETVATVVSGTKATALVPYYVQTAGTGVGTVSIQRSNTVPFTYTSVLVCLRGVTGATGPVGPTGVSGLAGATGVAGATGTAGATGVAGPTGAAGATGAAGEAREVGPTGATGAVGATGASGAQGAEGEIGPRGEKGEPGRGVVSGLVLGGTWSEEPITNTVTQAGIVSPNEQPGEATRVRATGGLFRLSNGLAYFHDAHEWVPPAGGSAPRFDLIWVGEVPKTSLGVLAKTFNNEDAELELATGLETELAEGAILRIGLEDFTVTHTSRGSVRVTVSTRQIRGTIGASHPVGEQVYLLGREPDSSSNPPGLTGYEYNCGYAGTLAEAQRRVAEESAPYSDRAWVPVAILEVPANATKSSEFVIYDVRRFV